MRRKRKLCNMVKFKELLKNPSPEIEVPLYTKEDEDYIVNRSKERITLKQIADMMSDGFKQVNTRIDNLEKDVNARIDGLEARIDRIEARLDYNGLKKLPINN